MVKRGDKVLITLWMEEDLLATSKKAADYDDVTLSELVRSLLRKDVHKKRIKNEEVPKEDGLNWVWPE